MWGLLVPLETGGMFDRSTVITPGGGRRAAASARRHTPGHQIVRVAGRAPSDLTISADTWNHPAQLAHPEWPSGPDDDHAGAAEARRALAAGVARATRRRSSRRPTSPGRSSRSTNAATAARLAPGLSRPGRGTTPRPPTTARPRACSERNPGMPVVRDTVNSAVPSMPRPRSARRATTASTATGCITTPMRDADTERGELPRQPRRRRGIRHLLVDAEAEHGRQGRARRASQPRDHQRDERPRTPSRRSPDRRAIRRLRLRSTGRRTPRNSTMLPTITQDDADDDE